MDLCYRTGCEQQALPRFEVDVGGGDARFERRTVKYGGAARHGSMVDAKSAYGPGHSDDRRGGRDDDQASAEEDERRQSANMSEHGIPFV